jgi:flagellar basal-body rod protein FlgF
MNYGYAIGASGVLAAMHRQDVAANNLANVTTIGFKADMGSTIPREAARIEDGVFNLPSNRLLEKLGAGVLLAPTRTKFEQGAIEQTGNPLDVAIRGDGFLAVGGAGKDGAQTVRYTRDGRMTLDTDGRLVSALDGSPILDEQNAPISLDPHQKITIDSGGSIRQGGRVVAELGFVDFVDRTVLRKAGASRFDLVNGAAPSSVRPTGSIEQEALEGSGVDPIDAMMAVQNAANAVSAGLRMMSMHDELTGRAISQLGRVA